MFAFVVSTCSFLTGFTSSKFATTMVRVPMGPIVWKRPRSMQQKSTTVDAVSQLMKALMQRTENSVAQNPPKVLVLALTTIVMSTKRVQQK